MIAVFLLGTAAVLLLHGYLYARNWIRALSVRVHFSQPHICAHEVCELTETIENRKRMALPVLEIGFRLPKGLRFEDAENTQESDYLYKRDLFAVRGMERIVRRYHVTAQHRGFYTVSQLTCHAPSRLFGFSYVMDRNAQEGEIGLFVYAARVDCSLLLRTIEVILGEQECARNLYEDPFVFAAIRPYTIRDPMKAINWKATAKTGELMVNTYASTSAVRVRIFLDVSADPLLPFADSLRELGIAMAASLIRALVKAQRDASLTVNCSVEDARMQAEARAARSAGGASETVTYPRAGDLDGARSAHDPQVHADAVRFASCRSAGRMTAVEEFLTTDFDSCTLLPFEQLLRQEAQGDAGQGAAAAAGASPEEVFVFLTPADRPSLRLQIHSLLGVHRSGILAIPSRTADGRMQERERNLLILPVYETTVTIHGRSESL